MMSKKVVIYGASVQGKVVLEVLRASHAIVEGFIDENVNLHDTFVNGVPVLGGRNWLNSNDPKEISIAVGIGNNRVRVQLSYQFRQAGFETINAIHPFTVVMPGVEIGSGVLICAGAVVVTGTRLEEDVVINTSASIDHDNHIQAGAYIAPGVHTAGCASVGKEAFIGLGAVIGPGVSIGDRCVIGAGSVVLKDLPAGVLAYGSPARIIRDIEADLDWKSILVGRRKSRP